MGPDGMGLWTTLLVVWALLLALRFLRTRRLNLVAVGGVLLILIAVAEVSTASGWGWPPQTAAGRRPLRSAGVPDARAGICPPRERDPVARYGICLPAKLYRRVAGSTPYS